MKVTSPADFSYVTPLGRPVEKGEEIDVDDELGTQLVAQGWSTKKKTRTSGDAGGIKPDDTADAPAAQTEE